MTDKELRMKVDEMRAQGMTDDEIISVLFVNVGYISNEHIKQEEERLIRNKRATERNREIRATWLLLEEKAKEIRRRRKSGEKFIEDEQSHETKSHYIEPTTVKHERYILTINGSEDLKHKLYGGLDDEEIFKFAMLGRSIKYMDEYFPEWRLWKFNKKKRKYQFVTM